MKSRVDTISKIFSKGYKFDLKPKTKQQSGFDFKFF